MKGCVSQADRAFIISVTDKTVCSSLPLALTILSRLSSWANENPAVEYYCPVSIRLDAFYPFIFKARILSRRREHTKPFSHFFLKLLMSHLFQLSVCWTASSRTSFQMFPSFRSTLSIFTIISVNLGRMGCITRRGYNLFFCGACI